MTQNNKYLWIVILILVAVGLGMFYMRKNTVMPADSPEQHPAVVPGSESPATTPTTPTPPKGGTSINNSSTAGFSSYASAEYNFTMKYPTYVQVRRDFATFHEIGNNWRIYPGQANQGKPIVSFSIHSIDQGTYSTAKTTYPLYFTAEVRVGVSPNIANCYATDAGYTNQPITNVTINGTTWKRFSTNNSAMMKYTQVESYRTIHNKMCFAVEQIKSGTSYRDVLMKPGVSDTALNGYYAVGRTIVDTFKFTK